jgi:thiamine-monophosphate kinase
MPSTPVTEFTLISDFTKAFEPPPAPWGPGDDCALIAATKAQQCVTTDCVVEGVHFSFPSFSLADVGHKALAVNLSDLAAMGATPSWMLCSLQMPKRYGRREAAALGRQMSKLAQVHGIRLIGGNVTRAPLLAVSLTVCGLLERRHAALLRSGMQVGDSVYVSGPLGNAALGLRQLLDAKRKSPQAIGAQKRPHPHVFVGQFLRPFASACIDVSDGLIQDLGHLAKASGLAIHLDSSHIPIAAPLCLSLAPRQALQLALHGGEDYVLAFSVPSHTKSRFERAVRAKKLAVYHIGQAEAGQGVFVDDVMQNPLSGYRHF